MKNLRAEHATLIGAAVNILLSALNLFVGVVATSGALVADGVHSLSDLVTDAAVLLGVRAAQRPPDTNHAYGHGRYETLAALFVGAMLLAAAVGILLHSGSRIADALAGATLPSPRPVAIGVAATSIIAKEIMFHVTRKIGRSGGSPALVANAWHHRSDALSSVATLVGVGGATLLGARWNILDPAAAGIVAFMIAGVGTNTVITALREMTDHSLPQSDHAAIKAIVLSVPGTGDPHNLKTRRLGSDVSIEVHFRVDGEISVNDAHNIASEVEARIRREFGESSTIITHVEPTLDR